MRHSVTIAAGALWAAAAIAGPADNSAEVFVTPNFSGGTGPYSESHTAPGVLDAGGSATGGASSSGTASSHVEAGTIKLAGVSTGSLNTIARGFLRDELTFAPPGVAAGTPLDVTFKVIVQGTLSASDGNIAQSGWALSADLGGGSWDISRSATFFNDWTGYAHHGYFGDAFGVYTATVQVGAGFAAPLVIELDGSAQTSYDGAATPTTSSFDLSHSLYWGGITSVTAGGVPVTGLVVTSASGTDYVKSYAPPVPEPGNAALMLLGLGALVHRRRQRRD